jgi:nitrate/TMAO reductase-like tetraheme cytochrome c subunit
MAKPSKRLISWDSAKYQRGEQSAECHKIVAHSAPDQQGEDRQ